MREETPGPEGTAAPGSPSPGSNELLLKFINSAHFTLYNNIEYLTRYSQHVGIHYYLCQKLLSFPHKELQFYIPQLVQVLLTVETESMALEELLLKLSGENPHFALLTFWQLQALLADLATDPTSYGFQVARRAINNLQLVLFNTAKHGHREDKMHENVAPAVVLCSMVLSSLALPQLGETAKPLVQSQGRRQKSYVFKLAKNAIKNFTRNMTLKNTMLNKKQTSTRSTSAGSAAAVEIDYGTTSREDATFKKPKEELPHSLNFDMIDDIGEKLFEERISNSIKMPKRNLKAIDRSYVHRVYREGASTRSVYSNDDEYTSSMPNLHKEHLRSMSANSLASFSSKASLDKLGDDGISVVNSEPGSILAPAPALAATSTAAPVPLRKASHHGANPYSLEPTQLSTPKKIKMLKANYFRCETQFAIALESISQRLAQVPTEARLSALRAELSLLNRDLPAEVDIPTLLPPSKKGKLHKLVNVAANEAQVLNSAEKVPYLLLIEYLRDEMDFDPTTEDNEQLLREKPQEGSYIFDLSYINKDYNPDYIETGAAGDVYSTGSGLSVPGTPSTPTTRKEMDLGDMSMVKVTNQNEAETYRHELMVQSATRVPTIPLDSTARNPELSFVMSLEGIQESGAGGAGGNDGGPDDLATQMRISAVMLAQLDQSPQGLQDSSNQIRAKIIASMQEVQDRFGYRDLEAIHGMAGERKLENDLKTGGLLGTKRETSYLGEDWATKREKIRKTSAYGHLENWDLCSVIAKSGDDLRQEAFACQLIQAMANIWAQEGVDVWVKKMKILITSANTGLVETITNAISVHSIKKSLTKKMVDDGELDEKGQIASLTDHFARAYGDVDSFRYKRAQDNFASSLAAYSVICYILQIKDRHNGNIMIDNEGHVVHIDFGFMLSNSPGSVRFEAAPFKLTYEYVDVLGGVEGEPYKKFVRLTREAFKALRKYADQLVSMCEIMQKDSLQPCFNAGAQTSVQLRQRFHTELTEPECDEFVETVLVGRSLGSIYTRLYDQFQLITQGIYS